MSDAKNIIMCGHPVGTLIEHGIFGEALGCP
jgi:hypothetical protein